MALIKSKTLDTGTTLEYWVAVPSTILSNGIKKTQIMIYGFKNKSARTDNKNFINREVFSKTMDKVYPTGEDVYEFVKTSDKSTDEEGVEIENNWFADAVDDK